MNVPFSDVKIGEDFIILGDGGRSFKKINKRQASLVNYNNDNFPRSYSFKKTDIVKVNRGPVCREFWICPFSKYSCGGYYIAEKFRDGEFWLSSGRREVLSKEQVYIRIEHCKRRGEIIKEVWADSLPEGSKWLNLR